MATEAAGIFFGTVWNALEFFGGLIAYPFVSHPEAAPEVVAAVTNEGFWHDLYEYVGKPYMYLSAAQYFLYWLSPDEWRRKHLVKTAPFFIPGAVMLGANLGLAISGEDNVVERMFISSLALAEGLAMLLINGVISKPRNGKEVEKSGVVLAELENGNSKKKGSNLNSLISIALSVGVSSALGGQIERPQTPDNIALIATQGAGIGVGLLPITLLFSGILKRTIAAPAGFWEEWKDSSDYNFFWRLARSFGGFFRAFNTPYAIQRIGRVFTFDIPSATARVFLGWDSIWGYLVFAAANTASPNSAANMWQGEWSSTPWGREAFVDMLRNGDTAKLRHHFDLATQRIPLGHMLKPHKLKDKLYPLAGIRRIWNPPKFPHIPQTHYFASLYQLITGGYSQSFTEKDLSILLQETAALAADSARLNSAVDDADVLAERLKQLDIARWLTQTLLAAREDEKHGQKIRDFFHKRRWILDVLGIDPAEVAVVKKDHRVDQRAEVRRIVKEKESSKFYQQKVLEHANRDKENKARGLFELNGESRAPVQGSGGPPSRVKKDKGHEGIDFDIEGGTAPLAPAPAGVPQTAPVAAAQAGAWADVGTYDNSDGLLYPEQEEAPASAHLIPGMQVPIVGQGDLFQVPFWFNSPAAAASQMILNAQTVKPVVK